MKNDCKCAVFSLRIFFLLLSHHLHSHFLGLQLVGVQQVFCASEKLVLFLCHFSNIRHSFGMAQKKMREGNEWLVREFVAVLDTERLDSICNRNCIGPP